VHIAAIILQVTLITDQKLWLALVQRQPSFVIYRGLCFATADVYISMEMDAEASACVQEAHLIFPLSPDVLFQVRIICFI